MREQITEIIKAISESASRLFSKISGSRLFHINLSKKTLIIGFSSILFLLLIVSGIVAISSKKENKAVESTTEQSDAESVLSSSIPPVESLKSNIMLLLTDGDKNIDLLSILRVDSESGNVRIIFIDPSIEYTVNGYSGSLQEHLLSGGINELMWAVGDYGGISIERYLSSDEKQFVKLIDKIGEYEITIDEDVSHEYKGINFIIDKGQQTLTADMMLKYFLYLCDNIGTKQKELTSLLISYAGQLFPTDDSEGADDGFDLLSSATDTDLSAIDYSKYKGTIIDMASSTANNGIIVENGFENFKLS